MKTKKHFIISLIYSIFAFISAICFVDWLGFYAFFVISVLIHAPIIYLLIISINTYKNKEYDISSKAFISDMLIIISSFLLIFTYGLSVGVHFYYFHIIVTAIPFVTGIGLIITLIVYTKKNLKEKQKYLSSAANSGSNINISDIKNESFDFIITLISTVFGTLMFFTFYDLGRYYDLNSFGPHIASLYTQLLGVAAYGILIGRLIYKLKIKDFNLTSTNSFTAISSFVTSILSLVVTAIIIGVGFETYNFLNSLAYWSIMIIFVVANIILVIISSIYFGKYLSKNKKITPTKNIED